MNIRKITLRLNLDKENDRIAWEYLQSLKGQSYTETVVNALVCRNCAELITDRILEKLKVQALPEEKQISETEQAESDEAAFNFLDSF